MRTQRRGRVVSGRNRKIKNSGSTEAAQILEDGKITEEELVQLGSSYAQCLTSKGITVDTGEARYPGGSISPSYGDNALDKRNLSEDEIAPPMPLTKPARMRPNTRTSSTCI